MDASEKYDAFISYSHRLDEQLAKRLQPDWSVSLSLGIGSGLCAYSGTTSTSPRTPTCGGRSRKHWRPPGGSYCWHRRKQADPNGSIAEVSWSLDNKPDPTNHLLIAVTDGRSPWDSAQDPDANGAASMHTAGAPGSSWD